MSARALAGAAIALALGAAALGCAPAGRPMAALSGPLRGSDGAVHHLDRVARGAPATVIVFFSASCDCQRAHDERLRALHRAYAPRGVVFVAVDSETSASEARARKEALSRAYPFPILADPEGHVADALGAEFATFSVVLDGEGEVAYRGGIDSDRTLLHEDATPWLRAAIDQVLAGERPTTATSKALGCPLQRW